MQNIWSEILKNIYNSNENNDIIKWLNLIEVEGGEWENAQYKDIKIIAKNKFVCDWIKENYSIKIKNFVTELCEFGKLPCPKVFYSYKKNNAKLGKQEYQIKSNDQNLKDSWKIEFPYHPNFTFENFVDGDSNRMAYEIALNISEGIPFHGNPITFYGDTAVGKTHLMNAIYLKLRKRSDFTGCVYTTARDFFRTLRRVSISRKTAEFLDFCQKTDYFFLDDIHILREQDTNAQMYIFELLNNFIQRDKFTIFTCESYPDNISFLENRIKTRLSAGIIIEILPPNFEMRFLILQKKAKIINLEISDEILEFIAEKFKKSTRELEGAINAIDIGRKLIPQYGGINENFIRHILGNRLESLVTRNISIDNILQKVAEYYGVNVADILSASRKRSVSIPRQMGMYLAKKMTMHSFPDIAQNFKRHHTTVVHACEQMEKKIKQDGKLLCAEKDLEKLIFG